MFPLAFAAPVAVSKAKWIAIGIVVLVVLAIIGGLYVWLRVERAGRIEAEAKLEAAELARDFYLADSKRWQAAAEERGRVIEAQNAAIETQRVDLANARQVIADAVEAARQASEAAEAQVQQWKERSRANPEQTHPIGPIARDAVGVLIRPTD